MEAETCQLCGKVIKGKAIAYVVQEAIACSSCYREGERKQRTLDAERKKCACSHFFTKIAGVSKSNYDGSNRQGHLAGCVRGEPLQLMREPNNPVDQNAIQVRRRAGAQLGYIPAHLSTDMIKWFSDQCKIGVFISEITGEQFSGLKGSNLLIIKVPPNTTEEEVEAYGKTHPEVDAVVNAR